MTIYENIVIGNFLFDLGVRMAKLRPDLPLISVNLLQQTPMDRPLGDILLANAAICRLLEFKRKRNKSDKERLKLQELKDGFRETSQAAAWEHISRQVHWYVEIDDGTNSMPAFVVKAAPYLEFSDQSKYIGLSDFANNAAKEACGQPDDEAANYHKAYLKFVTEINLKIDAEQGKDAAVPKSASSSAFAVAITKQGQIQWLAVEDIGQIFMRQHELELTPGFEHRPGAPQSEIRWDNPYDKGMDISR